MTFRAILLTISIFCFSLTGYAGADHSTYFSEPLNTGPDVTQTCLSCHETAGKEVMASKHWTWMGTPTTVPHHAGEHSIGKLNSFNNYCIAVESNWPRCTSCHVGFGWKDNSFDFNNETNVDCLICHDQTGTYEKIPTGAGMPKKGVDLTVAAKNVGIPDRKNCGKCHFYGGGGENVKHGDLDAGLIAPSREYDVHMNFGMLCQDCHTTDRHQMAGKSLAVFATKGNRVYCTDCHDQDRHQSKTIANHTKKVACQTCHIPYYAKGQPTKLYWDWSVAGENRTAEKDAYGMPVYAKKKGAFVWGQHVQPAYYWYNGTTERYLKGDKIDPSQTVHLNKPLGNTDEDGARIYPFKVMQGKQIYDIHNQYLIIPQLFGGYWKHFDWGKAAESGMKIAGLPYSGEYGFVKTQMYWGLDHMVSPKEDALKCNDCHGRGRRLDWKGLGYAGDPWQDK